MLRALLGVALLGGAGAEAGATDRVQQYLGLAQATRERPITPAELEAAALSPAGIEGISALFQRSLASSLILEGSPVTPELGGEATLDRGRLRFVEYPDPLHPIVRRMVELKDDPKALLDFLSQSPRGRQLLKTTGGLHALLFQITRHPEPDDTRRRALDRVLASAVSIHFKTWSVDPEQQLAMIRQNDWQGRYVGFWHIHPPRWTGQAYAPGLEPSLEDMTVALEKGQLLTIVFQPDGFDLYDLSPLAAARAPVLDRSRAIRHRSADWTRRFAKDHLVPTSRRYFSSRSGTSRSALLFAEQGVEAPADTLAPLGRPCLEQLLAGGGGDGQVLAGEVDPRHGVPRPPLPLQESPEVGVGVEVARERLDRGAPLAAGVAFLHRLRLRDQYFHAQHADDPGPAKPVELDAVLRGRDREVLGEGGDRAEGVEVAPPRARRRGVELGEGEEPPAGAGRHLDRRHRRRTVDDG